MPHVDTNTGKVPLKASLSTRFTCTNIAPSAVPRKPGRGTPLAMFKLLWHGGVVSLLLKHANTRLQLLDAPLLPEAELWIWQALTLTMGVARQPTLASYWSTYHFGEPTPVAARLAFTCSGSLRARCRRLPNVCLQRPLILLSSGSWEGRAMKLSSVV